MNMGRKTSLTKPLTNLQKLMAKTETVKLTAHYCERPMSTLQKNTLMKLKALLQKSFPLMEYDSYFIFNFVMIRYNIS